MSKIFKASDIVVDENNRVNIKVHTLSELLSKQEKKEETILEEETLDEPEKEITEENTEEEIEEDEPVSTVSEPEQEKIDQDAILGEILQNAHEEAEKIMNEADEKAKEIIAKAEASAKEKALDIEKKAKEEAEQKTLLVIQEAKEEGFRKGHSEGIEEGNKEAAAIKEEALRIREEALAYKGELIENTEPEIVELILGIIKKLISDEIEIDPQVIVFLIKKALRQVSVTGNIQVFVSYEDFENVDNNKKEIFSGLETMAKIEFFRDGSLSKGQCIIETPMGGINCNIGEQFKELEKSMYFLLKNR